MATSKGIWWIGGIMGVAVASGIVLLSVSPSSSELKPSTRGGNEVQPPPKKLGVAERVQAAFQAVMDDFELTKEREVIVKGNKHIEPPSFGMARVIPPQDRFWSDYGSRYSSSKEEPVLTDSQKSLRSLLRHLRMESEGLWWQWMSERGGIRRWGLLPILENTAPERKELERRRNMMDAALERSHASGKSEDFEDSGYHFATRPLVLTSERCLSCHQDRKVGDKMAFIGITWKPKPKTTN